MLQGMIFISGGDASSRRRRKKKERGEKGRSRYFLEVTPDSKSCPLSLLPHYHHEYPQLILLSHEIHLQSTHLRRRIFVSATATHHTFRLPQFLLLLPCKSSSRLNGMRRRCAVALTCNKKEKNINTKKKILIATISSQKQKNKESYIADHKK